MRLDERGRHYGWHLNFRSVKGAGLCSRRWLLMKAMWVEKKGVVGIEKLTIDG